MKNNSNISSIRRRLFTLLLRAFSIVVIFLIVFILLVTAFYLSYSDFNTTNDRFPATSRLETFYLASGSWDGVNEAFHADISNEDRTIWENSLLLDEENRIVAYQGSVLSEQVGEFYEVLPGNTEVPIIVADKKVGSLVLLVSTFSMRGRFAWSLLAPVGFISVFLAILTVIIGLFLMRRVVNPLSEVIDASGKVAAGDFSARVSVSGPDDLRALSDSFNHMAETLELNDRERRDLLADIAHELRTPLTVIRGRLEGILDGIYPPDGTQISPALEEAYLLERLVEDLRLLTLAETRQLQFEPRSVSLGKLAEHAIGLFSAEAKEKEILLSFENKAPEREIDVDPQRTEQVIGNLISNALRYVPQGGRVAVIVTENEKMLSLHVKDNGPGVSEEDLPHLFQRFWRGEKSRARVSGGAGLGLAIAAQLIEGQGGSIHATNLHEGGLQVTLAFPLDS